MVRRLVWLGAVALALGGAVVAYRGPGREFVRGHVGDVAATMLVYALLGLVWRARPWVRAVVTLAIASAIELGQTMWHATSWVGEMTAGGTFDAWDFAAYVVGVVIAFAWERGQRQRVGSATTRKA
ncbi:MAG TPA: DUF2809 domain-containing protein [Kofleriaceae bacterium]